MAKKWRVEITVSGISDEEYDDALYKITEAIADMGYNTDIGVGTEEEEE